MGTRIGGRTAVPWYKLLSRCRLITSSWQCNWRSWVKNWPWRPVIAVVLKRDGLVTQIVNVYTPNFHTQGENFFDNLWQNLFRNTPTIFLTGDFNCRGNIARVTFELPDGKKYYEPRLEVNINNIVCPVVPPPSPVCWSTVILIMGLTLASRMLCFCMGRRRRQIPSLGWSPGCFNCKSPCANEAH